MQIWTFLHILCMFGAVTVIVGAEVWTAASMRRKDLGALRAIFGVSSRLEAIGGILLLLGIIFGVITAIDFHFDLTAGWLVAAYVLVGATIVLGAIGSPHLNKVKRALAETDGDEPGQELDALLESATPSIIAALDALIIATIIALMVFKPSF